MKNVLEKELHRMPWFLFKKKSLHKPRKVRNVSHPDPKPEKFGK